MPKPLSNLSDAELLAVATQTATAMSVNPAANGTTGPQVTALDSLVQSFTASIATSTNDNAQAKASTAVKNADATALVAALRNLRDGAKVAGASDAEMAATALPFGGEKVPPSATVPVASVDTSNRMQHTISWVEATTPDNRRRPAGAMGAEIYVKLDGPPPIDESQCTFVTVDSATPYTKIYDGTDAGKMAHYLIRWRMRDGSVGAWAETVSATITG